MTTDSSIQSRAMLVSLSISVWTAHKHDKRVTREVADAHHTTDRAGRYNKNLLPIDAPTYKAVSQAASAIRTEHYTQTLPWSDEGARILPAANYLPYTQKIQSLENAFNLAVFDFLGDYPVLRDAAESSLNGLFNAADYPTAADMSRRFSIRVKILPLPSGDDFRVDLTTDAADAIRAQIESDVSLSINDAMKDVWTRLHDAVSRMVERLSDADGVFRDSLVGNLRDLANVLPRLNLSNDPRLAAVIQTVQSDLCQYEPETLRSNLSRRSEVAARAAQIAADLAGYMGSL